MSKALGLILLRMVGAANRQFPRDGLYGGSEEVDRRIDLDGNVDPHEYTTLESDTPLLPGPVHPRMGGSFSYGGPFSGKIRRKSK